MHDYAAYGPLNIRPRSLAGAKLPTPHSCIESAYQSTDRFSHYVLSMTVFGKEDDLPLSNRRRTFISTSGNNGIPISPVMHHSTIKQIESIMFYSLLISERKKIALFQTGVSPFPS